MILEVVSAALMDDAVGQISKDRLLDSDDDEDDEDDVGCIPCWLFSRKKSRLDTSRK